MPGVTEKNTEYLQLSSQLSRQGFEAVVSVDFRLPEGHPRRYGAVVVREGCVNFIEEEFEDDDFITHKSIRPGSVNFAVMPARQFAVMSLLESQIARKARDPYIALLLSKRVFESLEKQQAEAMPMTLAPGSLTFH